MPSQSPDAHSQLSAQAGHRSSGAPRFAGLDGLSPGDRLDTTRLLSMMMTLAGEVYVLKGEVERLKIALADTGAVGPSELAAAAGSAEMSNWLDTEEREFGESLLRAYSSPDDAPDVSAAMIAR